MTSAPVVGSCNDFIVGVIVIPFRYEFIVKRLGTSAISEILANV